MIGVIVPILFTPIIIDAVESDYDSAIVVEFTYPKNFSNLKTDFDDQMTQLFANDKPSIIDSALVAKSVVTKDKPSITDSAQIELIANDKPTITDSTTEVFLTEELSLTTNKIFQVTLTEKLAISEKLELE